MLKCKLCRLVVLLLYILFSTDCIKAQNYGNINFTEISVRNGLSSNTINDIIKDKYGYVWYATEDGLNRFDGKDFTVYRYNYSDSTSLQSNAINCLYEDKKGTLWIGTNGGSLAKYIREKNCFYTYKPFVGKTGLNSSIKDIGEDYLGNIWIASYGGLNILNTSTNEISLLNSFIKSKSIFNSTVVCVFEDSQKRMWVGTDKGLFLYNRKGKSFISFTNNPNNQNSLISNTIKDINEDNNGQIWIGTNKGICKLLAINDKKFKRYPEVTSENTIVYTIKKSGKYLWIGTEDGLYILNIDSNNFYHHKANSRRKLSLSKNSIRSIYIDKQGIYWIGTYQGGVNKFDLNLSLFNVKEYAPYDPFGLKGSVVTSFAEKDNHQVFVGTDKGGVSLYNRITELFYSVPISDKSNNLSVLCLLKSTQEKLWIGTFRDGLFVKDLLTNQTKQYKPQLFLDGSSLNHNEIFCLEEDRFGKIWIGTNGNGLCIYDPKKNKFSYINKSSNGLKLPLNGYIRSIVEDNNGNIWIGSHGTGLAMFDPLKKIFTVYDRSNSNLPDNSINNLFVDSKNRVWVGTVGGGVSLLNKATSKFIVFSEKDGLLNSEVYKVLEDKQGNIWLSTNKGISRLDIANKIITNFTAYNGVLNNNFVRGSGIRLSDGTLFFGNLDGFNFFNRNNLKFNKNIPPILLTDLKISNKSNSYFDGKSIENHISVAKEVILNYNQDFAISYTALNFTTPQQNKYSYKLEGYDEEWNMVGSNKTASYTNINPGEYIFKVRASNNDGIWNLEGTSINIIVKPPFWATTYAYIFYLTAFLLLLYILRKRGIQKIELKFKREQELLQAKQLFEQEKREVERQHNLDRMKLKFFTNLSHEFRTPISLILAPADKLIEKERNHIDVKEQASMIKRNAKRLLNLVNQLLDFRKMEEHELKLKTQNLDLIDFIKDTLDSFKDLSETKKITLECFTEVKEYYTFFDADKIERVLFNLLSNAFKFTNEGGKVSLLVNSVSDDSVTIKVSDTGIGIPKEMHNLIFMRFFQNNGDETVLNQGSGIGLSITKEFVKMHGGEISVKSEPNDGSTFIISLPFKKIEKPKKMIDRELEESLIDEIRTDDVEDVKVKNLNSFNLPVVLIVEDNDDFRFYLKDNLKSNYKILEATNGKEAWQSALYHHPHLIVSDINMPIMDGITLSSKIRLDKRTSHIPIILLTALTDEEDQLKGLETGANDYITKPFNFEILNTKIKNILQLNKKLKDTYLKQIKVETAEIEVLSDDAKFLNKVLAYVEENLNDSKLSVNDLSKSLGMSRGTLYNKLLEINGTTPIEFIRSVKLEKALLLLEKSDLNVNQIAYCVGFATPNYFGKSFKAKYNILPSEYISLNRKNTKDKIIL